MRGGRTNPKKGQFCRPFQLPGPDRLNPGLLKPRTRPEGRGAWPPWSVAKLPRPWGTGEGGGMGDSGSFFRAKQSHSKLGAVFSTTSSNGGLEGGGRGPSILAKRSAETRVSFPKPCPNTPICSGPIYGIGPLGSGPTPGSNLWMHFELQITLNLLTT